MHNVNIDAAALDFVANVGWKYCNAPMLRAAAARADDVQFPGEP